MSAWPIYSLEHLIQKDLITLGRGKVISKHDISKLPGPYPIYSSAKDGDGKFGEYGKYLFDEELITWSVDGGGKLFHRPKHKFSVTNVGGYLRIKDTSRLQYRYLWYALTFEHAQIRFDWVKKAHPSVLRKEYQRIPLPPLSEQQRIVAILDQAFENIAKVKANAQSALDSIEELPRQELKTMFMNGRDNWFRTRIGDQLRLQRGYDITKSSQKIGTIPVVSSGGVRSFHNESRASAPGVVIGRSGSIGSTFFVETDFWPHNTTLFVSEFRSNQPRLVYFLFLALQVRHLDSGSANPTLNRNIVHNLEIFWPPFTLQASLCDSINALLSGCKALATNYRSKLEKVECLKTSLLHQAFSGGL